MTSFGAQRHITNVKVVDLAEEYAEIHGKPATPRPALVEEAEDA
jgi:hypothetical protein